MAFTILKSLSRKDSVLNVDKIKHSSRDRDNAKRETIGSLSYTEMRSMYELNLWVRACIDKICGTAAAVKPIPKAILEKGHYEPTDEQRKKMDEIRNFIRKPNIMKKPFRNILKSVFNDINVYDAAAIEWVRDITTKKIVEGYPVSGETIRLNVDDNGIFKSIKDAYRQVDRAGKTIANFNMNEMSYMVMNPRARTPYGLSKLETLVQTVTAELYASDFNLQRFANDATPKVAVLLSGAGMEQGGPLIKRFQTYWNNELKGQPHKPMFLSTETGKIEIENLGMSNEEMQFQQYSVWLATKIAALFDVPLVLLGLMDGSTGKLNSEQQDHAFKRDAIHPLLNTFAWHFNTDVIWADDSYNYDDVYLHWEGIDLVDETLTAKIHETYLRTGVMTINMVLNALGRDGVPWGNQPYMQKQYVPVGYLEDLANADTAKKVITGTENEDPVRLNDAITKLLKTRERELNRFWLIPENTGVKNVIDPAKEISEN